MLVSAVEQLSAGQDRSLNLRGCSVCKRASHGLAVALRGNTSVEEMDLHGAQLDDEGVACLAGALLEQGRVRHLDLGANGAGAAAARALSPLLRTEWAADEDTPPVTNVLRTLRLARNELNADACAELLSASQPSTLGVESLSLAFNPLSSAAGEILAGGLRRAPSLHTLQLQGSSIGSSGCTALAAVLPEARVLKHLDLCANDIGDAGGQAIAQVLPHSRIAELLVAHNRLTDTAGRALSIGLVRRRRCTLQLLVLRGNKRIGDSTAEAISKALSAPRPHGNRSLTSLDLAGTAVTQAGAMSLGDALVCNSKLTSLDLGRGVNEETARALEVLLAHNRSQAQRIERVVPNESAQEHVRLSVQQLYTGASCKGFSASSPTMLDNSLPEVEADAELVMRLQDQLASVSVETEHLQSKVAALEHLATRSLGVGLKPA